MSASAVLQAVCGTHCQLGSCSIVDCKESSAICLVKLGIRKIIQLEMKIIVARITKRDVTG